jgi:hypothetical protein
MGEGQSALDKIRSNLTQTVIARPLLDYLTDQPDKKANLDLVFDVIIDPNLDYHGGLNGATARIKKLIDDAVKNAGKPEDPPPNVRSDPAHPYVFAKLAGRVILELVRLDATAEPNSKESVPTTPGKQRLSRPNHAIYRVWEDTEIEALITNSLATVKADAAHAAFTAEGADIVWAVIDSGIDKQHPHFNECGTLTSLPSPVEHRDFTGAVPESPLTDEFGHGSHVAGIIAGKMPLDKKPKAVIRTRDDDTAISSTVQALKRTACGMAPMTKLLSLKVLNPAGRGKVSAIIEAITYIQKLNDFGRRIMVHGVNLSVGYPFMPEWFACGQSPVCVEVDRLVRSGVVVVAAAGNSGYGSISAEFGGVSAAGLALTINDPGNADRAITVGSTHRDMPHTYGVSYFSSKGPTGDGRLKPDVVAPGERILSCAAGATKDKAKAGLTDASKAEEFQYIEDSGTSMAAPHVSGVIAAFLSIRREFIGKPDDVKKIFMDSATDLKRDRTFQGCGLVDLMRAIQSV